MGMPTRGSRSIEIDGPPSAVYDLISDVTRTGEWSPECRTCAWVGEPGLVGSEFKGTNKLGPMRWTTTARLLEAERPDVFEFATLFRNRPATRWRYELSGDQRTTLTESFVAEDAPAFIKWAERLFLRNRQEQLEAGIDASLARIKAIVESS
jgi:hypothetical protein